MSLPPTMRAVVGAEKGPISALRVASRPTPRSAPLKGAPDVPAVVVKVHYAALNPIDWKMAEMGLLIEQWPYAFGCDISGEVVEVEPGSDFKTGDKVWAFTLLGEHVQGAAFAEYVRVPAAMLGKVPPSVTMEAASTVGLGTLTAAMGTYKCLELPTTAAEPGKTPVLVYGASSATGVFAVSLLKNSGYRVVAVASKKNHKWLQDTVGAAQCVDYKDANWVDQIAADSANKGLKYAVDCIGNAATGDWTTALGDTERKELTGTLKMCDDVLRKCGAGDDGVISTVDPFAKGTAHRTVAAISTILGTAEDILGARKYVELAEKLLEEGTLITMPTQVLGGLEATSQGLQMLKDGKVSRTKLVVKV